MKKILVFLCAAALMLIPLSATASMQAISDSEMAAVTGQAGVDISLAPSLDIDLKLKTVVWGDPDGFTGYTNPGYVNLAFAPGVMNVDIAGTAVLAIDVGTTSDDKTAVKILATLTDLDVTLNKLVLAIYFDSANGALTPSYNDTLGKFNDQGVPNEDLTKCVGIVGLSGLGVNIDGTVGIQISPHAGP